MKKSTWEFWVLLGLLAVLTYTGGSAIEEVVMSASQSIVNKIANAIAIAEGFFNPGSRPRKNHNPGDFERDITGKGVGFDGPYVIYANDEDGWDALKKQVALMFEGSSIYNPNMTISDVAYHYADGKHDPQGAANWAANVAAELGVDVDMRLIDIPV
jgi:hypothetical protein